MCRCGCASFRLSHASTGGYMKFIIVVAALAFSISAAIVSAQETAKDFAKDPAEGKTFLPPPPALPDDCQTISTTPIKHSLRNAETVHITFMEPPKQEKR